MECFGSYETGREISSSGGVTVRAAHKRGETTEQFAVKILSLPASSDDLFGFGATPASPADEAEKFVRAVEFQKQAGTASPHIAPVLDSGRDERGVWLVTRLYPRSIQGLIERRVTLAREGVLHLLHEIVLGLLEMKKDCGRSHGNLKSSNVLFTGGGRVRDAQVFLTDPAPGELHPSACELADLRNVGLLLYQLVRKRKVDDASEWLIAPIPSSKEWTDLFGSSAGAWLAVCNKLLDRDLSLERYNLENLEADLAQLQPKPPVSARTLKWAAALLVIAGVALGWWMRANNRGTVEVKLDPVGAHLTVNGKPAVTQPPAGAPRRLKLPKGRYELVASYRDLLPMTNQIVVEARKTTPTEFRLAYGGLLVTSDPTGAVVRLAESKDTLGTTPHVNDYARPGPVKFQIDLRGHQPTNLEGEVQIRKNLVLLARLIPAKPGDVLVELTGVPSGADIVMTDERKTVFRVKTGELRYFSPGTYTLTATYSDWPQKHEQTVQILTNTTLNYDFANARIDLSYDPPSATVWIGTNLVATAPTNVFRPPGPVIFQFKAEGYQETNYSLTVVRGIRERVSMKLLPQLGFARISSDRPAAIFNQTTRESFSIEADAPVVISLRPGPYILQAKTDFFGELTSRVELEKGKTNLVPFQFPFGRVQLSSDPPGAIVEDPLSNKEVPVNALSVLREGAQRLVAHHPDHPFVPETNEILVVKGTTKTSLFQFKYASLTLRAHSNGVPLTADVTLNGKPVGQTPFTTNFVPFGAAKCEFKVAERKISLETNITVLRENCSLSANFGIPDLYSNKLGMEFEFRPEAGCFVSRYEVTWGEYCNVMAKDLATMLLDNKATNADLPVWNVSWSNAAVFFQRLNQNYGADLSAALPEGGRYSYAMPTEQEWTAAARLTSIDDRDAILRRPGIEAARPVHRRSAPPPNGVFDLYGNLAEWSEGTGSDKMIALGGSFDTNPQIYSRTNFFKMPQSVLARGGVAGNTIAIGGATVGLRCVLRPKP